MRYIKFIFALNIIFACFNIYAKPSFKPFLNLKSWNFVENKGQLADQNGEPIQEIKYYGHQGSVYLYCQPGKISFVFTKVENENIENVSEATGTLSPAACPDLFGGGGRGWENHRKLQPSKTTTSRADLILVHSNPAAQIIASNQQEYYENYYTANAPEEGITNVHTYKTITYKSIYPNIDLVLHAKPNGMKYEFVVNPGGKVSDIQLQWNGLEGIKKLKNSGIEYSCLLGKMDEDKPVSFQGDCHVNSDFLKTDNIISFKTGKYNKSKTLVIDPSLVWATYFGGPQSDGGLGVAADNKGNVYLVGSTISHSGIATQGAYQTSYVGSAAIAYLAKFNSAGNIIWATYYGGNEDYGSGIVTDKNGGVYVTGGTVSTSGIATNGAYQTVYAGGNKQPEQGDAYLVKFNTDGLRVWGTYFGGKGQDVGNSIATDSTGNVYITGFTDSQAGIATNGAYQTNSGSSGSLISGDAFLAKFNGNGVMQWATYYGYNGNTEGMSIAADKYENVYMCGETGSDSGIATKGAYQTSFPGSSSAYGGFLAKFNGNGAIQWGTYYKGETYTIIYGVAADLSGDIYITGMTKDTGVATVGAFQTSNGGAFNAFLAKFNPAGSELWATYYGSMLYTVFGAVTTDGDGFVYISGLTRSQSGIATSGAYETSIGNGSETGFIARFSNLGQRTWASYYKQNGDIINAMTSGDSDNIYITGMTGGVGELATIGAYQTSFGGNEDAYLTKFNFKAYHDGGIPSIIKPQTALCTGAQSIKVQLHDYGVAELDSATIAFSINRKIQPTYNWKGKLSPGSSVTLAIGPGLLSPGEDTIKAWASYPNGVMDSMPGNDTSILIINVGKLPVANAGQSNYSICTGTHIKIGANAQPNYTYSWSSNPVGFTSTLPDPVINPGTNTIYNLTVTDTITGCTNQNSANVSVSLLKAPVIDVGKNQSLCAGDSARIGSTALSGDGYLWTSDPVGYSSKLANPVVSPLATTSYLLTVTSAQGCTNFDSLTITVNPKPVVVTGHGLVLCAGLVIPLGGPPNPGYTYSWTSNPPGFFSNLSDPKDSPMITTEYHLKVTIPATGCTDSGNITFGVMPQPAAPVIDVKNIGGFEYIFKLKNPDPAANYIWSFGDSSITHNTLYYDTVMPHTYTGNGIYKLTVEAAENHCVAYTHEVIDVNQAFSLNIFPNPFDLQTGIQYTLINPAHVKVSLIDEVGRQIGTLIDQQQNPGEYNLKYDGAAWKTRSGMYFIVFQLDDQVIVKKIIQLDSIYF